MTTAKIFAADSVQTFSELEQNALRIAAVLRERGVRPGERVLLKAGNSAAYVATLLALMHAEASIVLVDPQERAEQTRFIVSQAGAALCLVDDDAPMLDGAALAYLYELAVAAAERTPTERHLDFVGWGERPDGLIMWSSGSTGSPKGVVKSGRTFLRNLQRNADHMGHRAGDVLLPLLPFSHQYGLSMVLIAWLARCSLVIAPYRRLDRALRLAGQAGATVVDATPATYRSILNLVERKPALGQGLHAARMLCAGAAPLDPTLVQRSVRTFGLPLLDSYGSTEMGNVTFATTGNPVGCGLAVDGLAVRVVRDIDPGPAAGAFEDAQPVDVQPVDVQPGEAGEILVRSPDLMVGYLGLDGAVVPVELDGGWYRTNDLGYLDARGNLFVLGRKLAVQRLGFVLHPEVIEHRLAAAGCSVKIVPAPDERRGTQLTFVVEDEQERPAPHWRERICDILPPYEHPNRVLVVERFPLNHNGKPDRKQLEQLVPAPPAVEVPV